MVSMEECGKEEGRMEEGQRENPVYQFL